MALFRCSHFTGRTIIRSDEPRVELHRDVLYDPSVWVLYDFGKRAISSSGYFRGPAPDLVGKYTTDIDPSFVKHEAPDECYFFIGVMHVHYGHFLLASLARAWAYCREKHSRLKLLTYGRPEASADSTPFIGTLLNALGITYDDLISFDQPTLLREVIIPCPCFEETNFAHDAFARMFRGMGESLLQDASVPQSATPIYLARFHLPRGVHRLVNEEDFVSVLEDHGVEVAFPEQLSLAEQIRLLAQRSVCVGWGGSAFHTAAFVSPRKFLMLHYGDWPLSNQVLIDRVCGHDSLYLYPPDRLEALPADEAFTINQRLRDPRKTAEDTLRILDSFTHASIPTVEQEFAWLGKSGDATPGGRPRRNLALRKPTRQSSIGEFSRGLSPDNDSAGAVSGFCTGSYQFCTNDEYGAWWEVDLCGGFTIDEIRIFNRLDHRQENCCDLTIAVSVDRAEWQEVLHHAMDIPFGGLDGNPLCLKVPPGVQARYVRVIQNKHAHLHLDQVVVYGFDPDRVG